MSRKLRTSLQICAVSVVVLVLSLNEGIVSNAQDKVKGDPAAGKTKAQLCAACHGPEGISVNPLWPNLAGQHEQYLAKQIKAYRDGERSEVTMDPFVKNLSDQDIADLAAYYASLSPCP